MSERGIERPTESRTKRALVTIGDVGLADRGGDAGAYHIGMCGKWRSAALALIYRQEPCRYVPVDLRQGQGFRELAWSEIAWENDWYGWDREDGRWAR